MAVGVGQQRIGKIRQRERHSRRFLTYKKTGTSGRNVKEAWKNHKVSYGKVGRLSLDA